MKAQPGDRRLGSNHSKNVQKADLIKSEMKRVHDEIKAEGIYPTLRKILRAMPFWVHETLACDLRHELIEEGLIPQPPRGAMKSAQLAEQKVQYSASLEEIAQRKLEIREEYLALMRGNGETGCQPDSNQMTPQQASEWARKRYKTAWESVQAISRHTRCWAFLAHPETV